MVAIDSDWDPEPFHQFVVEAERRLSIALAAVYGPDGGQEASAEAIAYLWEHRDRVAEMENPIGYLYRVGQPSARRSFRSRSRIVPDLPVHHDR